MSEARVRTIARRTKRVDLSQLDEIHDRLAKVSVALDPDPGSEQLRALFAEIRDHRNSVSRILAALLKRLARYRADLVRFERTIEAETAHILWTEKGLVMAKNDKQRQARVRVMLEDLYLTRDEVKDDVIGLDAAVAHTKHVMDELRFAFEEASRSLSTIELEYRIERSAP